MHVLRGSREPVDASECVGNLPGNAARRTRKGASGVAQERGKVLKLEEEIRESEEQLAVVGD